MAAGLYNFDIEQGSTVRRTLTYRDGEDSPIDLTGCAVRMQVRRAKGDPTTLLSLSLAQGLSLPDPTDGVIVIEQSAAVTAAFRWTSGYYDLEVQYPDDTVDRVLEGRITVSREVTR